MNALDPHCFFHLTANTHPMLHTPDRLQPTTHFMVGTLDPVSRSVQLELHRRHVQPSLPADPQPIIQVLSEPDTDRHAPRVLLHPWRMPHQLCGGESLCPWSRHRLSPHVRYSDL